jgi:hypothetical protein
MTNETTVTVETTVVNEVKAQRGRPVVDGSARQQKLAAYEAKIAAGIEVKRGRPSNPNSSRQARLAAREAKIAAGYTIAPGRPSKVKADSVSISDMLADIAI